MLLRNTVLFELFRGLRRHHREVMEPELSQTPFGDWRTPSSEKQLSQHSSLDSRLTRDKGEYYN